MIANTDSGGEQVPRRVVPADIDTPDQIAWGLSFRQLAILAAPTAALYLAYSNLGPLLPVPVWVGAAIVVFAIAVVVALGRRDGLPMDVWIRHGLTMRTGPALAAPGSRSPGRPLLRTLTAPPVPAPLRAEVTKISAAGALTVEGTARTVIACGTTSVGLRTGTEQAGLLDAFGRWLNALTAPVQIVVCAARHDLTPYARAVLDDAGRLPSPALRAAAEDYAAFLLDLDRSREPLRRQVLTVQPTGAAQQASVRALTSLGISAQVLDGPAVAAALAAAADPYDPPVPGPRAVPVTPITARRTP
jgi:hypothetical protein